MQCFRTIQNSSVELFSKLIQHVNNFCEAFNGRIVPTRNNNILTYLEEIRQLVMKRLYTNRDLAQKWVGELGPRIKKKLHYNKEES